MALVLAGWLLEELVPLALDWRAWAIMDSTLFAVSRNASDNSGKSGRSSGMWAESRLYTDEDVDSFLPLQNINILRFPLEYLYC